MKLSCILLIGILVISNVLGTSGQLYLQFGDFPSTVQNRVASLLQQASQLEIITLSSNDPIPSNATSGLLISLGNTLYVSKYIDPNDLSKLGSEGFIVQTTVQNNFVYLVANGNPEEAGVAQNNNGLLYAAYNILEQLGFAFFHPLEPTIPPSLTFPTQSSTISENPYWPFRGFHIHTQHPLELTNLLNGFGDNMTLDDESWSIALPAYTLAIEWMVANRQNRLEIYPLCAEEWQDYCASDLRSQRYQTLTSIAHEYGVSMGPVFPLAEEQQHAWFIVQDSSTTLQEQFQDIHQRMDWLVASGFDFLSSENGYSEFTHGDDITMLTWMNETARYLAETYGKKSYMKVHCSTGQVCKHYKDPWTGQPLNFNFLPIYADSRLGVYPHTVQFYTWDDPAPTYGNQNFEYMFNFTFHEAGKRDVVYYGETAYWVNYDVDVPLFLPLYAYARLSDLRKIATTEIAMQTKIQGQMNFDSGWEWGYWFQDVITARAVWNPRMDLDMNDALSFYINTITRLFGPVQSQAADIIANYIQLQRNLLVYGEIDGQTPSDIVKRNGIAYIAGWDTWSDIGCTFSPGSCTQPNKLGLQDLRLPFQTPNYETEVYPLLLEMMNNFTSLSEQLTALSSSVPSHAMPLFQELVDSTQMTSLRATQVFYLYQYVSGWLVKSSSWRQEQLANARTAMESAIAIIQERETHYRVPVERIAGWGPNPTVYTYGYLWTVHSAFYFWRDYGKALDSNLDEVSPCFMNIINPIDVAFGEGIFLNVTEIAREVLDDLHMAQFMADCLAAPKQEPSYNF